MKKSKRDQREEDSNLVENVIYINRVAKVVKGGRRFSFSAIVVVGDGDGSVGVGFGKANEVPEAIRKGTEKAKRAMKKYPLIEGTVPHRVIGHFGAGKVLLRPAAPGTGVIAGPMVRAIMEALGIRNLLSKSLGTSTPANVVRATFEALELLESPTDYANRLGLDPEAVMSNYTVQYGTARS
jgi:small subunit ribosomal protein S5